MSEEVTKQSTGNKSKFYSFLILGTLLFASGAIISGVIIKEQPQVLGLSTESDLTSLISKVGKLIVLPSNELPTITTISDATKLNDQPFFKSAKNADKLLVYTNAKWAVLYRPSENKIVQVGAFDASQQVAPQPTTSPTPSPTPTSTPSATPSPTASSTLSPSESPKPSPSSSPKP